MKHILLIAIIIGLGILTRAESEYTVTSDGAHKILKGLISRDMLEKDAAFSWFHQNHSAYTPDAAVTALVRSKTAQVRFLVFTATWNEDAQYILPRFYSLMDAAYVQPEQITLVGVDREKKTLHHLTETMHITSIPTFIVLKNGKEIGRVEPKDKYSAWEKDLTTVLQEP
ncbi:MAG TPA: thioredoxin family protein [Puia sp.]|nr:thioredoxin family protein [Puia sp.]